MVFATVLAIVLASCIGFLFARTLVRPVNTMAQTARAIKEGDLSARTGIRGEDEIARLGMTFDEMADSIERDRKLERRLTTDVAHELRTPLMACLLYTSGILRELQIMAPTTAVLGNNDYDEYGKNVTRFAHPVILSLIHISI